MFHNFSFINSMVDAKRDRGDSGFKVHVVVQHIYVLYVMQINNLQTHCLGLLQLTGQFLNVQISEILRVNPNALSENELKKFQKV